MKSFGEVRITFLLVILQCLFNLYCYKSFNPNRPQSNKIQQGEVKKMCQVRLCHRNGSHVGTKALPRQRHPGRTVHYGAGGPGSKPGGNPHFLNLPFRGESLEMKKGAREFK